MSKNVFFDLKSINHPDSSYNPQNHWRGIEYEFRKNRVCSISSVFTKLRVQSMHYQTQRTLQGQKLFLLEPVSLHGLCSTDSSRKSPGHRNLSEFTPSKTLSHRLSWSNIPIHSGICQRNKRFSHISGLRPHPHRYDLQLYQDEDIGLDLKQALYAFDSTTTDLCLSTFPWARFRKKKAAIKIHTLLNLRGSIPTFLIMTTGRTHDVKMLDAIPIETDSICTMDRAYLDFGRLYQIHLASAFFVIKAKRNLRFRRLYLLIVE